MVDEDETRRVIAQLRHAYQQLHDGVVGNQLAFADGLIAPAIRMLERMVSGEAVRLQGKLGPAKSRPAFHLQDDFE